MNESNNFPMMYQTEAAVAALNKVPGLTRSSTCAVPKTL